MLPASHLNWYRVLDVDIQLSDRGLLLDHTCVLESYGEGSRTCRGQLFTLLGLGG